MKIAIDLDDTLSKVSRVPPALEYIKRNRLPYRVVNEHAHVLEHVFDWSIEETEKYVHGGGIQTFTEAPVREGVIQTLARWKQAGHFITVLTARWDDWFGNAEEASRAWLVKNGVPFDSVVAKVSEKGKYCVEHGYSVLIEDNLEICRKAQALGVNAILFVDKHNEKDAHEIAYRGRNWEEIEKQVSAIFAKGTRQA